MTRPHSLPNIKFQINLAEGFPLLYRNSKHDLATKMPTIYAIESRQARTIMLSMNVAFHWWILPSMDKMPPSMNGMLFHGSKAPPWYPSMHLVATFYHRRPHNPWIAGFFIIIFNCYGCLAQPVAIKRQRAPPIMAVLFGHIFCHTTRPFVATHRPAVLRRCLFPLLSSLVSRRRWPF